MLGSITIVLKATTEGSLPMYPGRYLNAALFSLISTLDKKAGDYWHGLNGIKPFSVVLKYKEHRKKREIYTEDVLYLHISIWHHEFWEVLENISEGMLMEIGPINADIIGIDYNTPFGLPLSIDNELDFVKQCLTMPIRNHIKMTFTEPTSFNSTYGEITFPTPTLIFSSIVDKWNAGDFVEVLNKQNIRSICERIVLTEWKGRTQKVYFGRDRGIHGFIGSFSFSLEHLAIEERCLIMILALFAMHTGVGRLSSQGLGAVVTQL